LMLITEGSSNRQIAQAMLLAEGTIKNYVSRIMAKLHANTRTELAVNASRRRREG
jgi:DNA-binding NarL/FixJ family response regulator